MVDSRVSNIKRAQQESLLFRSISELFTQTALDDPRLRDLFINRVRLTPDKSTCYVYFYSARGKEYFEQMLNILKLYKPSLRKAIAQKLQSRRAPDFVFSFDDQFEKQQKIEALIDKVKVEEQS